MPCDACQKKIADLEEDNKRLRLKVWHLQNKLSEKNREINRFYNDSFESVDFGNGYDK